MLFYVRLSEREIIMKKKRISVSGSVPAEDEAYEKEQASEELRQKKAEEDNIARIEKENLRIEKEQRAERERRLAQEKIELMKLRSGVIEESEEIKEEHEQKRELTGLEKIANIWYHDKVWICFGAFIVLVLIFMIYDAASKVDPDITIIMICDNGLQNGTQTEKLEQMIAAYTPDLNGDGEVKVTIMNCPLNSGVYNTTYSTNSDKVVANLMSGEIIMFITDSSADDMYVNIMDSGLSEKIEDNPYIDEYGLSLDFAFLARELEYENMPDDIHICLRTPIQTYDDTLETMQENYDINLAILTDFANALYERAELEDDEGLSGVSDSAADSDGTDENSEDSSKSPS